MTSREASARLGGRVRSVPSGPSEFLAERVASGLHVKGGRISGARSIFRRGKGVKGRFWARSQSYEITHFAHSFADAARPTTCQRRFFHGRRPLSVPAVASPRPFGPLTRHRQPDTIRRNNGVCWTRGAAAVVLASMGVPIHWVPLLEARGIVVARSFKCSGGSPAIGISRPCNSTLAAYMAVV